MSRGAEERVHREQSVGPGKRNNVFQVRAVGTQPGMKVNQKNTAGLQHSVTVHQYLVGPAQMLRRVDCVDHVDAVISQRY